MSLQFGEKPYIDPDAWLLPSERTSRNARNVLSDILSTGEKIGLATISQRELLAMSRTYGFGVTHSVHKQLIARIEEHLPSGSAVFLGNLTLMVIVVGADLEDMKALANRLDGELSASYDCKGYRIGFSFFISVGEFPGYAGDGGLDIDEFQRIFALFEEENEAEARNSGQRVFPLTEGRWFAVRNLRSIDRHMPMDLERGRFRLVYQPRVDMRSGKIVGAEALLRWHNEELGPISPNIFIPMAERNGHIHSLTPFVIKEASRRYRDLLNKFGPSFTMGINLSGVCIRSAGLPRVVAECLREHDVPSNLLDFEITESQMIEQKQMVISRLNVLRELGCRTALDDFGTGYSNMAMLSKIPLDILKIDRAFVSRLSQEDNERDVEIAGAIYRLGKSCGLEVIAEGMELQTEVDILVNQIGCVYGQGYRFSEPVALEALLDMPTVLD